MTRSPRRVALDQQRGKTLPDLLGPQTKLLFVGTNPGLSAAAVQAPFPGHTNRFFPALYRAGITNRLIDTTGGWAPGDKEYLAERGIGIAALVPTATARADELSAAELTAGADALAITAARTRPAVIAILGITGFRIAFRARAAIVGRQPRSLAGAELWVVPNPSGLNARTSLADLATAYREVAIAAGIDLAT
jgi:double-stranded uracil-DNA glycosylase